MRAAPRWNRHTILAAIRERGMTLDKLALMHGRNAGSFRNVWKRENSINERIIAEFLGVPVEQLWPDRYPKVSHRIYDSKKWGEVEGKKSPLHPSKAAA